MEYIEVSAKTVNDAIIEACQKFGVASDKLEHEVIEEGSAGFWESAQNPPLSRHGLNVLWKMMQGIF